MKKLIVLTIVVATLLAGVAHAKTQYVLQWQSAIPVDISTIVVDVRGGGVIAMGATEDATTGWVWLDAEKACVGIVWKANTVTGIPITVSRQWDDECVRWYLPTILAQDTLSIELP
jgi:hypothetical protein